MSDTGRYNFSAFTARVIERARATWPDGEITTEGHQVIITWPQAADGQHSQITLSIGRGYREYWTSGDLAGVLQKIFGPFSNPPITRAEIEARAMLKVDHAKLIADRPRLHWRFDANPDGVIITGVLDYPGNMHFFDEGCSPPELHTHGVTKAEFWIWGMAHLRTMVEGFMPQHLVFAEAPWRGQELWVLSNGSAYASAALLCHDIVDSWMPKALKGYGWVAGIPDRDTLIIARPDTPAELLASAMANGRAAGLYPYDWTIYAVERGQVVNFWGSLSDTRLRELAAKAGYTPPRNRHERRWRSAQSCLLAGGFAQGA